MKIQCVLCTLAIRENQPFAQLRTHANTFIHADCLLKFDPYSPMTAMMPPHLVKDLFDTQVKDLKTTRAPAITADDVLDIREEIKQWKIQSLLKTH